MSKTRHGTRNRITEWGYTSGKLYDESFTDVTLDVVVTSPSGREQRVPAYWAGDQEWRVRVAPQETGSYTYRTECSDETNPDLHGREGEIHVASYTGDNPLFSHGPVELTDAGHFAHADGEPFFWLGDTWWMCLTDRLEWPGEFKELTADRLEKGFSVIHLVGGLFPDMDAFDERGENAAGWAWQPEFDRINPGFFDLADLKIEWLIQSGLVPCIFGAWGYYLPWLGIEKMQQHWRYLVARYSAYPVMWSIAGETTMPYYLSETRQENERIQQDGWADVARFVRDIDPYDRSTTSMAPPSMGAPSSEASPPTSEADAKAAEEIFDFDLIQTNHWGHSAVPQAVSKMQNAVERSDLPVVNGEGNYEGILQGSRQEVQRFLFWGGLLSGHVGHSYGANGIWQLNRVGEPYGPSPTGVAWGNVPWNEAYRLPGSTHVGVGKRILEEYDWWRFEPHPEWIEVPDNDNEEPSVAGISGDFGAFAAGIPSEVRICYIPPPNMRASLPFVITEGSISMVDLDPDAAYDATFVDPKDGSEIGLDGVDVEDRTWEIPGETVLQDWLLILER